MELAFIMPLYVFLILGILQLGLMHQARLMTKYAAYKAVRAGALHNGLISKMEPAALAVLLPLISKSTNGKAEWIKPTKGASDYLAKWSWAEVKANRMSDTNLKYVDVAICGPLKKSFSSNSKKDVDFDDPANAADGDWEAGERTKLRIQVTFNYRMPIPFANMIIHRVARNREVPKFMLLGKDGKDTSQGEKVDKSRIDYGGIADRTSVYVTPIRATYTMRMQSNLYVNKAPLPDTNPCIFAFGY